MESGLNGWRVERGCTGDQGRRVDWQGRFPFVAGGVILVVLRGCPRSFVVEQPRKLVVEVVAPWVIAKSALERDCCGGAARTSKSAQDRERLFVRCDLGDVRGLVEQRPQVHSPLC
jgi:hypothetical protein